MNFLILSIIVIIVLALLLGFFPIYKNCPYHGKELRLLRKGSTFYHRGNIYVKHVFHQATKKYICLSSDDIVELSGKTLVFMS